MIDLRDEALRLKDLMEQQLPISVRPTKELLSVFETKGQPASKHEEMLIENVFYSGDEGGIVCGLQRPDTSSEEVFVVSLTHLIIARGHPLAKSIQKYQKKRIKALRRENRRDKPPFRRKR